MEWVFLAYRGLVMATVARSLPGRPDEDVEDVASCLWERLYSSNCARLASFRGANGACLDTWLVRVARNAAVDRLRLRQPRLVALEEPLKAGGPAVGEVLEDRSPGPLGLLAALETRAEVAQAVRELPLIYKQVVYARFYRRWTTAAAARAFGIAQATIYVRLCRALALLRRALVARGVIVLRGEAVRRQETAAGLRAEKPVPTRRHRHLTPRAAVAMLSGLCPARGLAAKLKRTSACRRCWRTLYAEAAVWGRVGWALWSGTTQAV